MRRGARIEIAKVRCLPPPQPPPDLTSATSRDLAASRALRRATLSTWISMGGEGIQRSESGCCACWARRQRAAGRCLLSTVGIATTRGRGGCATAAARWWRWSSTAPRCDLPLISPRWRCPDPGSDHPAQAQNQAQPPSTSPPIDPKRHACPGHLARLRSRLALPAPLPARRGLQGRQPRDALRRHAAPRLDARHAHAARAPAALPHRLHRRL